MSGSCLYFASINRSDCFHFWQCVDGPWKTSWTRVVCLKVVAGHLRHLCNRYVYVQTLESPIDRHLCMWSRFLPASMRLDVDVSQCLCACWALFTESNLHNQHHLECCFFVEASLHFCCCSGGLRAFAATANCLLTLRRLEIDWVKKTSDSCSCHNEGHGSVLDSFPIHLFTVALVVLSMSSSGGLYCWASEKGFQSLILWVDFHLQHLFLKSSVHFAALQAIQAWVASQVWS